MSPFASLFRPTPTGRYLRRAGWWLWPRHAVQQMETISIPVPDLLNTVKQFVQPDKHGQLDQMLNRYHSKELGKEQLSHELRSVVGRDAVRQALLAVMSQIEELHKKSLTAATSARPSLATEQTLALAMARHPSLGAESPAAPLDADTLQVILKFVRAAHAQLV